MCRFEEAVKKLETETKEMSDLLKERDAAYEEFLTTSAAPFSSVQVEANGNAASGGLFSGFFGSRK